MEEVIHKKIKRKEKARTSEEERLCLTFLFLIISPTNIVRIGPHMKSLSWITIPSNPLFPFFFNLLDGIHNHLAPKWKIG